MSEVRNYRLGPVERWVVGIGGMLVVATVAGFTGTVNDRLDKLADAQAEQAKTLAEMGKQQAVANQQLATLNAQLANVPALAERIGQAEVRIEILERRQFGDASPRRGAAP